VTNVSETAPGNNPIAPGYVIMHGTEDVTANYTITAEAGTLTVTPAPLTIAANQQNYSYTGSAQGPAGTYEIDFDSYVTVDGLVGGDVLTSITLSGSQTDAGFYDDEIEPSAAEIGANTGNYDITYVPGDMTILDANAIQITSSGDSWTYDGVTHTLPTYTVLYEGVNGTATPNGDGTYS
jgi:hypothetical protein